MIDRHSKSYPVMAAAIRHDVEYGTMLLFAWARVRFGRRETLNPHETGATDYMLNRFGLEGCNQILEEMRASGVQI